MKYLLAIVGPTAVGKSDLALSLAQRLDGEIVNADSRQVYRYMDIGTAKPAPEERALVPYHLLDVVAPDQAFSLAGYQELAGKAIQEIHQRHRLPLLVGGSGQYVWSVIEGWNLPQVPPDPRFRQELEQRALREGHLALYQELQGLDPAAAASIDPRNVRRVIRALEVCHAAGIPFSQLRQRSQPAFHAVVVGLTTRREDLFGRIDTRVDNMIEKGLVQEVQSLIGRGYRLDLAAMSSIGYKQIGNYLQGDMSLSEAVQRIKFKTHWLARHQYAWFRLADPRIHWFDVEEGVEGPVAARVKDCIEKSFSNGHFREA